MMFQKRILGILCVVLMLLLALAGCGTGAEESANQNEQRSDGSGSSLGTVRVATLASGGAAALFLAEDLGLPEKYGVNLEITFFQDPEAMDTAFTAKQFDVDIMGLDAAAALRLEGVPVSMVVGLSQIQNRLVVKEDFPGDSMADLQGKTVGMPSTTGSAVPIFSQMAEEAGFDYLNETEVKTGPPPSMPQLLDDGEAQTIEVWEPHVSRMLASGNYRVLANPAKWFEESSGHRLPHLGWVAHDSFVEENSERMKAFVAMVLEGAEKAKEDPLAAAQATAKRWDIDDEAVIESFTERLPELLISEWDSSGFSNEAILDYLNWVYEAEMLRQRPDMALVESLVRFDLAP